MDDKITLREWVFQAMEAIDPEDHFESDEWVTIWSAPKEDYNDNEDFEYSSSAERPASDVISNALGEIDDFALTHLMDYEVAHTSHYTNSGEWDIIVVYD